MKKINWKKVWFVFQAILLVALLIVAVLKFTQGEILHGLVLLLFTQGVIICDNVKEIMHRKCKCCKE